MVSPRKKYELRILSTTLLSDSAAQKVAELDNNLFTGEERKFHKKISEIVKSGDKVEPGLLDQFDLEYLNTLMTVEFNSANIDAYIDQLKDTIKRDYLTKELSVIISDEFCTGEMMVEKISEKLESASGKERPHYTEKLVDTMKGIFDEVDNRESNSDHLKTGYDNLDQRVFFDRGDLVVIAARPAMGKTAYALNLTSKLCFQKHRGAFFSLEMDKKQLMKRMVSIFGGVDMGKIMTSYGMKKLTDEDMKKIADAIEVAEKLDLEIVDMPGATLSKIRTEAKRLYQIKPLDFIVVDYMQLIRGPGENRTQEITNISLGLKDLARELRIPVIALSQLSRAVEQRADRRPMMSDLRESGQIEQDASVIQMLYRDDYYNEDSEFKGVVEVLTVKNRNGTVGTDMFMFKGNLQRFNECVRWGLS